MKKILSLILVIAVLFTFGIFAMGSGSDEETGDQGSGTAENAPAADNGEEATEPTEDTELGDYSLAIDSCRLAKDYEGKPVVIVKYIFTNVSDDEPGAFWVQFDCTVYQNGVSLNECLFVDDSANYSSDNQMKEIKKGASLEVEVAYELNDETTDIEVEVSELFSWDDKTLTKTFSITQ